MLIGAIFHWQSSSFGYVNWIILISQKLLLRIKTALKNCSRLTVPFHDISQITFAGFYCFEIVLHVEMGIICLIKYFGNSKLKEKFPILEEKKSIQFPFPREFSMGDFSFIPTLEADRFPKFLILLVCATYARLNCLISVVSTCFPDKVSLQSEWHDLRARGQYREKAATRGIRLNPVAKWL